MFEKIYWDTLSDKHKLQGAPKNSTLHVIWPSTVDSDACFADAGFTEFADSDSDWDANWQTLIERVVSTLSKYGDPIIENPQTAVVQTSLLDRIRAVRIRDPEVELTLIEQLVLATTVKGFGQAVVNFGSEHSLTLVCGDDHPLLWVFVRDASDCSFTTLVDTISVDCQQQRLGLDWQHLIPSQVQE